MGRYFDLASVIILFIGGFGYMIAYFVAGHDIDFAKGVALLAYATALQSRFDSNR